MKLVSFNINGLSRDIKKMEVRDIVKREGVDFLLLQETKLQLISSSLCRNLWHDDDFAWLSRSSQGRSGGLLLIWRPSAFELHSSCEGNGYIGITGMWKEKGIVCNIINVYDPCVNADKRVLWTTLQTMISNS